jgi:hypothetical protein
MAEAKKTKTKAKPKAKKAAAPVYGRGDIVIVRKGADTPKIPAGVNVWLMEGDALHLTPRDMYDRGWIRRKG